MNAKTAKRLRRESEDVFADTFRRTLNINPSACRDIPSPHRIYKEFKRRIRRGP